MTQVNFEHMRSAMVSNQLRTTAVSDPLVVAAMSVVPRESFVPADRAALAYIDTPVPLEDGRALNPPLITGRLLTELGVEPGDNVLVVGAATGYSAALLAEMGANVTALEQDKSLAAKAKAALASYSYVNVVSGAHGDGWKKAAPYDVILVDGAVAHVPDAFAKQLKDGGRIAAIVIERGVTRLASGQKAGDVLVLNDFAEAEAVILPGFDNPKAFVF